MPSHERGGARHHYRVEGSGAPDLLIHSATSTGSHEWDALVRRLHRSFTFIVPDLRSHGASDHIDGALGLDEVVADLRSLIAQVGLGRPHVVGFSFGAEVALEMEIGQQGTAQSLILVSPGTGHSDGVPKVEKMALRWPRALRELHTSKHGSEHWRTILEVLTDDAANRVQVADDVLSSIGCPILLVVGSKDQLIRVQQALHLAEINSRASLVTLDGVGHRAHAADPDTFADVVAEFLAASGTGSR